jgi:cytochrome c oxidase subunit II
MSKPSRSRTGPLVAVLIAVLVVAATVIVLAAAGITPQRAWDSFFPIGGQAPATAQSQGIRQLYDIVFYIAVVIFVVVEALIVWSAFRYRRKPGDDELPPQTHGNNLVEVIWTAIPTVIVLVLFVLSFQTLQTVDAKSDTDVRVRAVAARFQWSFDYLDANGDVLFTQALPTGEAGGMTVPVGEPVHVTLRSPDVIHAFYVPKFLFKRDVVPGKENNFDFTVEEAGTYRGQCAELCGAFHGAMIFDVHAVPPAEFDAWLAAQIEKANATPAPSPTGPVEGPVLELSAKNVQFSTDALQAPAGTAFGIKFVNDDPSVQHNVEIKDAGGAQVFLGDLITGPAEIDYTVPALPAGTYTFICTVHPNMTGTLTVQ